MWHCDPHGHSLCHCLGMCRKLLPLVIGILWFSRGAPSIRSHSNRASTLTITSHALQGRSTACRGSVPRYPQGLTGTRVLARQEGQPCPGALRGGCQLKPPQPVPSAADWVTVPG